MTALAVTILPAAMADLAAVTELESEALDGAWGRESWAEQLASVRTGVLVARDAGEVVGVIAMSSVADVADLDRVIVRSDHRRTGLGRRLVAAGLAWARRVGAQRVLLEVAERNDPARGLYAACGFAPIARRAHYYGPGQDALVLEIATGGPGGSGGPGGPGDPGEEGVDHE